MQLTAQGIHHKQPTPSQSLLTPPFPLNKCKFACQKGDDACCCFPWVPSSFVKLRDAVSPKSEKAQMRRHLLSKRTKLKQDQEQEQGARDRTRGRGNSIVCQCDLKKKKKWQKGCPLLWKVRKDPKSQQLCGPTTDTTTMLMRLQEFVDPALKEKEGSIECMKNQNQTW